MFSSFWTHQYDYAIVKHIRRGIKKRVADSSGSRQLPVLPLLRRSLCSYVVRSTSSVVVAGADILQSLERDGDSAADNIHFNFLEVELDRSDQLVS